MDTFEAISNRRAIKKFDPNHKMTSDEVDSLMKLTILSPTSYNQQNWRFEFNFKNFILNFKRNIKWDQDKI